MNLPQSRTPHSEPRGMPSIRNGVSVPFEKGPGTGQGPPHIASRNSNRGSKTNRSKCGSLKFSSRRSASMRSMPSSRTAALPGLIIRRALTESGAVSPLFLVRLRDLALSPANNAGHYGLVSRHVAPDSSPPLTEIGKGVRTDVIFAEQLTGLAQRRFAVSGEVGQTPLPGLRALSMLR